VKRGVMNSLARTRAMRFDWQKLVSPHTPKAEVAEWQSKDAEIQTLKSEAQGVATKVEPVDWAYWRTQVLQEGLVDQMEKDYNANKFPVIDPMSGENVAKLAQIAEETELSKKEAVHAANEVKEADKVIATVHKVKAEGLLWSLEQWQAFMPGLAEQQKEQFEDEEYIVDDESMKMETVDWKTAAKEYAAGNNPDLGIPDEQIGDMNLLEEQALMQAGTWSIARVFAGKEERARIQSRVEKTLA
jgi:hypothetical protein